MAWGEGGSVKGGSGKEEACSTGGARRDHTVTTQ